MLQIVVEVAAGTVCDADCSIFSQTEGVAPRRSQGGHRSSPKAAIQIYESFPNFWELVFMFYYTAIYSNILLILYLHIHRLYVCR